MNRFAPGVIDGAVVLVTGAGGGIGRALCAALRTAGARVAASDVCDAPGGLSADAWLRLDVTAASEWAAALEQVSQRFGRLDCLVNNAGMSFNAPLAETSLEQWRRVMSVNVESALLGMQAALPWLRESGAGRPGGAAVVNISSTAGLRGVPLAAAYAASKAALTLLSKSAAKEFAALGYPIRVNSVHPGAVQTAMTDAILARYVEQGLARSIEEQRAAWMALTPLRRMAQPEEIAGAVVYLCSSAASFVTGAELVVDGGSTA